MSLRQLAYLSLLLLLVTFTASMTAPVQQLAGSPVIVIRWEYKMLRLEGAACLSESDVTRPLNLLGQDSWELVTYERSIPPFPRQAEGTLLIKPAATGPARDVQPQTADSFEGNISMEMVQPQQQPTAVCTMLLKRPVRPLR